MNYTKEIRVAPFVSRYQISPFSEVFSLKQDRAKPVVVSHNDQQGPPLDFSFKNIETIESLKTEKPRKGNKNHKKTKDGKYSCFSLRINNNYLENISGIHSVCLEVRLVQFTLICLIILHNYNEDYN